MTLLALHKLVKVYNDRTVVNSVSLKVESSQVVGLLGPNGAGKTTTFYMTIGMVKPDGGEVFLDDEDITEIPCTCGRARVSAICPRKLRYLESYGQAKHHGNTGTEPLTPQAQKDRADELLEELGIRHLADQKARVLSGGERRRLEISRCLATNRPLFCWMSRLQG